jgi:multidrug efflux system outer membrane protein
VRVSYEVDLWGKLRAGTTAARADLLATESARDTVRLALVAQVVRSYFTLSALDARVELTRRTIALREDALRLQQRRNVNGLISDFELRQLEAEAATVRAQLPPLERDRDTEEAALAVLLGRSPRAIFEDAVSRGRATTNLMSTVLPEGMPSELLLRRPDVAEAEQRMIAANARIAEARSAMFPVDRADRPSGQRKRCARGALLRACRDVDARCGLSATDLPGRAPRGGDRSREGARSPGACTVSACDPDRVS